MEKLIEFLMKKDNSTEVITRLLAINNEMIIVNAKYKNEDITNKDYIIKSKKFFNDLIELLNEIENNV